MNKITIAVLVIVGVFFLGAIFWMVENRIDVALNTPETDSLKENYMEGCVDGKYDMVDYCDCTYVNLKKDVGISGIVELGIEYEKTGEYSDTLLDAVTKCIGEIK